MIIKLLRYLMGYIVFNAEGGFPDRFINLCTRNSIPLWNIQNIGGKIKAATTVNGYLDMKKTAKMSGMKIRAEKKSGLVFLLKKNKKRVGILIGLISAFLLILLLSQFVWTVSVVGNSELDTDFILSEYEKLGVKVGMPVFKLDNKEVADQALQTIDGIVWTAVNRKGTAVVIEVREAKEKPEIYDGETPSNVIASEDGLVLSVDLLSGNAEIKAGSAVTKGDLLISGVIKHKDGKEIIGHGAGYVKGLVKRNEEFFADEIKLYPLEYCAKRTSLYFFGLNLTLGKAVPKENYTKSKSYIDSKDTILPLGIIKEWGGKYSNTPIESDEELNDLVMMFRCGEYVKSLLEDSEVVKMTASKKKAQYDFIEFYAECEKEIGKMQEIYIE